MADPAAPLFQSIKDANPITAMVNAASNAKDRVVSAVSDKLGISGGGGPSPNARRPEMYFNEPAKADEPVVLTPEPHDAANAKYQQEVERQARIARAKAYFAAHPEQYQPSAQPTEAQKRADLTGSGVQGQGAEAANPAGAIGKAAGIMGQPGANVVEPGMSAMGMPRTGKVLGSALDYYMWPPNLVGTAARQAGMSDAHATLLQHAVSAVWMTGTVYGALRGGKAGVEALAQGMKQNPESELGAGLGGAAGEAAGGAAEAGGEQAAEAAPPKSVTPEVMYTTGTKVPGRNVTPGAEEPIPGEEAPPSSEAPKNAAQIPHHVPDVIAEATRTPFSKDRVMNLKGDLAGVEEGHEMPSKPLDAVDSARLHLYATDQVRQMIDAAQSGDMEKATSMYAHIAEDVRATWRGAAHQAGYGLRLFGQPAAEDVPNLKDVWDAIENSNAPADQMVKAIASLPDAATARKFVQMTSEAAAAKAPGPIGQFAHGLANYYTHALLSINTIAKKAATDSFMMAFGPAQTYVGEQLSKVAGALGAENTIAPGRAAAGAQGYRAAAQEAMQLGWKAMKNNVSALDQRIWGPAGYHDPSEGTLSGINVPVLGQILGWYGTAVDLPARGILGIDNFAKVMQQRRFLHEFAWQKAYDDAANAGLEGEEFAKSVQDNYGALTAKPTADMMARSIQEARRSTMTAPLSDYGLGGLERAASSLRSTAPGQMMLPFFNTPMNLAMQGLEFGGPLGLASKVMRDQLLSDTPERFTALAKMGMGALLWAAVWDNLHGGSSDNAQVNKLAEGEEQHQPYSITIGNHERGNIPAPLDNTLGLLADGKELIGRLPPNSQDAAGIATALSLLIAKQLNSSSSMQNLSGFVNLLASGAKEYSAMNVLEQREEGQTPESVEEQESTAAGMHNVASSEAKRQLQRYAGSFIPSTVTDIAHGIDPIHRQVRNYIDEIKARTPGLSKSLPPDVDLFGKEVRTPLGWNRLTGNTITLWRDTYPKDDPVIDELKRLNPAISAIGNDGTLSVGEHGYMEKVPVSPAQVYQAQKLRGFLKDPVTGQTLHEALGSMMNDSRYKAALPADRITHVTRVITGFTHAAIAATVSMNPDIQANYIAARQMRGQMQQSAGMAARLGAP